jgi:hypothetical protein
MARVILVTKAIEILESPLQESFILLKMVMRLPSSATCLISASVRFSLIQSCSILVFNLSFVQVSHGKSIV